MEDKKQEERKRVPALAGLLKSDVPLLLGRTPKDED